MKTIISFLIAFLFGTQFSLAAYVLWVGIDEHAVIHDTNPSYSEIRFADWVSSVGIPGGQIRIGDMALIAGFEDPSGYIPPGQKAPSIVWETDFEGEHIGPYTDFELAVYDVYRDIMDGMYADWQLIKLPDDDPNKHIAIYYDIGFFNEDTYDFTIVATATGWLDEIYGPHGYESGTLAPPTQTPWRPLDYYTYSPDVPEPSSAALALFGIAVLFSKRKKI